jgi:hypothetical protein
MPYLVLIISSLLGFLLNLLLSKPDTKINKHLPEIKIKIFQFCPSFKISFGKRTFHIHHWMSYSFLLIITITMGVGGLADLLFIKGFCLGGIIQGLTFPDWKKIIYKKNF